MRTNFFSASVLGVALVFVSGCATKSSVPVRSAGQVGRMVSEEQGEVIGVQEVVIEGRARQAGGPGPGSQIGAAAIAAAVLNSPIHAAVAAGQVMGGIAGANMDNKRGEELTILLRNGRTVVVVQEQGKVPFVVGEKVRIKSGGSSIYGEIETQVEHDDTYAKSF